MASKIARVADLERALAAMRLSLNNMRSEQSRGESDSVAMLSRVRELEVRERGGGLFVWSCFPM